MCLVLGCTWFSFKGVLIVARLLDSFLEWSLAYNSLSNSLFVFNPLVGFLNYLIILLYPSHCQLHYLHTCSPRHGPALARNPGVSSHMCACE